MKPYNELQIQILTTVKFKMSALIPLDLTSLPSTEIAGDYDSLSKGVDFLGRVQLFTKGKAIDKGLIRPGHWGIFVSDDEIQDLGTDIDIVPLARRPKAMDFSDKEQVVTVYDDKSAEFARITAAAGGQNSNCMYGISFLVYERSTGRFLELFFGTKSTRPEAKNIYPALPTKDGGPFPLTLGVKHIDKKYSYHVPVVRKCSTPFLNLPEPKKVMEEIQKFVNPVSDEVETVTDNSKRRAR